MLLDMKTAIGVSIAMVMGTIQVGYELWPDDVTNFGINYVYIPKTSVFNPEDIRTLGAAALTVYLNANGYAAPDNLYWGFDGETVPASRTTGFAAVATSGAYADLTGTPSLPSTTRTTSIITPSLVGTGATGTQVSATKDSSVRASVSTSTTVNIASGAGGTSSVALKICSTNNATEASWTTVATLENDQTISLALALGSVQVIKGQLVTDVPAGWFYKLVNSGTGTHTEVAISGQETIYG